ncbi:MAG: DASS family sodium-coupled anion symporter [Planctomycetes bacterium]|nr:DASS family sodium-coupled anion symporter [Planctomycetota bacterium]
MRFPAPFSSALNTVRLRRFAGLLSQFGTDRIPGLRFASRPGSRRTILIIVTLGLAAMTYAIGRMFLEELAARALAIFVVVAIFWATETLPLFATAFLAVGMEIIFLASDGGLAEQITGALRGVGLSAETGRSIDYTVFFGPFAKDIIFLFMGGFLLSAALTKHGIDVALASRLLQPFRRSPGMLLFATIGITAFFSMWMSNTATTAMVLAITGPLLLALPESGRFHRGLILGVAFGANIGGIGTPIGTPPNAIAFGALNAAGYEITFLSWMLVAVPLAFILMLVAGTILYRAFPPAPDLEIPAIENDEPITGRGWMTVLILLATVALWLTSGWHGIRPGAVALLAATALTSLGLLDRHDVDSIDWNLLILMWGGLSLSVAMRETGLSDLIATVEIGGAAAQGWVLALIVTAVAVTMSTFMSNTATAALLMPMALALSIEPREQYAMLAALACSFAMSMPVSTPPNAMAFATGNVPIGSMIRTGTIVTLIGAIIVLAGYQVMLPIVFS